MQKGVSPEGVSALVSSWQRHWEPGEKQEEGLTLEDFAEAMHSRR